MPVKNKELANILKNQWLIGLLETPCNEPAKWCQGMLCPCCSVMWQREELLQITGEPYYCCGGMCPCGPLKNECNKEPWLCVESFCCCWLANGGNRFIIQTRFSVRNSAVDEFIICCMVIVSWTICILELCGTDVPDELEMIVNILECMLFGCMFAQQQHQIEHVKATSYQPPPPEVIVLLPPTHQKMINDAVIVQQPGMPVQQVPPQQHMQKQQNDP